MVSGAVAPTLIAAGLGDLADVAVVGVRVAHESAAARRVQGFEAVIIYAAQDEHSVRRGAVEAQASWAE